MLVDDMRRPISILVLAMALATPAASHAGGDGRQVKFGVGAGGVFLLSSNSTSPGVITSVLGEFRMSSSVDLRVETSYAELPARLGGDRVAEPAMFGVRAPDGSDPVQLAGAGISVVFLGNPRSFGRTYFLLGAGGWHGRQGEQTRTGLLVGPGLGWAIGGSVNAGIELNAHLAIVDSSTFMMIPVRLIVRF
jgi:hypothetical protein